VRRRRRRNSPRLSSRLPQSWYQVKDACRAAPPLSVRAAAPRRGEPYSQATVRALSLLRGARRSVGETRALGQSRRVFAGVQPLPMASVIVPRHVRSSRSGGARSRQPRAARTLHRTVVHPRSRFRGYATSSPAPRPRPPHREDFSCRPAHVSQVRGEAQDRGLHDLVAIKQLLAHLGLSPPEEPKPPPAVHEVVRVPVDEEGREMQAP
jgi:hypothetical protein